MTDKKHITIVSPVYNEQQSIVEFIDRITKQTETFNIYLDFIFIDDGSTDRTLEIIKKVALSRKNIEVISLSRNFGKEAAIFAGLENADADAVIVMDSDLQHPPELLNEMVRLWVNEGYKLVEAKKVRRGEESFLNKLGSKVFYSIMSRSTQLDFNGATDFKLLDRDVVSELMQFRERVTFFRGLSSWLGHDSARVPFTVPERYRGSSSWSFLKLTRLGVNAITSFSAAPLHVVTLLGFLFLIFSILLGLQTIFMYLTGKSVGGFTTVILLLLIIGATISIGIGMIGIYLSRIYDELKFRPRYIVKESTLRKLKSDAVEE